jgi:L-ascorbate metabolism protein UlaG (beta-lactamase superfamily)
VLLESGGRRILTDPLLRSRIRFLRRHGSHVDPACYERIDVALISHTHWDHYDVASLRKLGRDTPLVVPRGAGRALTWRGFRRVHELAAGDAVSVDGLVVEATAAAHRGFGPPLGPTDRCLGFLIDLAPRVYFAGDTDLFPAMAELAGRADVALLPIWGWGPVLGRHHLDPRTAADALRLLRPRIAIPIHWGTLHPLGLRWLRPDTRRDPPHAFAAFAAKVAPSVDVRIVPPGRSTSVA